MDTCRAPTPQLNIEGLQEQDPTPAQQRPRQPPRKRCKLDIVKGEMGIKLAAWCLRHWPASVLHCFRLPPMVS